MFDRKFEQRKSLFKLVMMTKLYEQRRPQKNVQYMNGFFLTYLPFGFLSLKMENTSRMEFQLITYQTGSIGIRKWSGFPKLFHSNDNQLVQQKQVPLKRLKPPLKDWSTFEKKSGQCTQMLLQKYL